MLDRYTKALLTVIAVALVWMCLREPVPVAQAAAKAKAVQVQRVVRARGFELVDEAGHTRGVLRTWGRPGFPVTTFAIMDAKGQATIELCVGTSPDGGKTAQVTLTGGQCGTRTYVDLTAAMREPQMSMAKTGPETEAMPGHADVVWKAP